MDISGFADGFDSTTDTVLGWVSDHGDKLFGPLRAGLEGFYGGVFWSLSTTPWFFVVAAFVALGWRLIGVRFGLLSGLALVFCAGMGLWPETMSTLALVATATAIALAFAIPLGILAAVITLLVTAGLRPGRKPPAIYDPAVMDGKILVGVANPPNPSAIVRALVAPGVDVKSIK